ncbi:MAG: hypothetical protein P4L73_19595 [Caulobacteraceae bacterium]|nr:hypothetical protein [Caulobacteraceae bacterium]
MSSLRAISAIVLFAGLAAACSKPAQKAGAPAPAASSAGGDVVISQADLPHPRVGEWEMIDANDGAASHSRFCVGDRPINLGRMREHCQKLVIRRGMTGGLTMDAECGSHGVSSKMHVQAKGDFQSSYSTDVQMAFTLRPGEPTHVSTTHMEYRYVGPCPPGEAAAAEQAAKGE